MFSAESARKITNHHVIYKHKKINEKILENYSRLIRNQSELGRSGIHLSICVSEYPSESRLFLKESLIKAGYSIEITNESGGVPVSLYVFW